MRHLLASSLSSSGPERGRLIFINSSPWKYEKWWTVGYGLRNENSATICSPLRSPWATFVLPETNKVGKIWHRRISLPALYPAKISTMKLQRKFPTTCISLSIIHPWFLARDGVNLIFKENRCSILCKLSNAHLTLNFCQGPLPEAHSSQNQFVNIKRNQLHLEVTWLVPRSFKREPAIATFPKFRCTFQAFENLGVPQPAS